MNKDLTQQINALLPPIIEHVTAIRHHLHEHPEVKYEEVYTSSIIQKELDRLKIPYEKGLAGGTGVVGLIQGQAPVSKTPPVCIALRTDIDALPITEETGLPYASKIPGRMHACGHDGHMAILLGTAALLKQRAPAFSGSVKLLFQPAEEGGCGAERFCNEGVLDDNFGPKVDCIFGLHGWPELKVGTAATRAGTLLASVDEFLITLTGKGTHAAAPHKGVDPIVAGAAIVQSLQTIISRQTDPTDAAVLSVTQFHAGSAFNVIPQTLMLNGTIRTLSLESRNRIFAGLQRIVSDIASAYQCRAEVIFSGATPPTINDPVETQYVQKIGRQILDDDHFFQTRTPAMWGEDFAFYLQKIPGCFYLLGVQPHDRNEYPMLHHPLFDFTDAAIPCGVQIMTQLALNKFS